MPTRQLKIFEKFDFCSEVSAFLIEKCSMFDELSWLLVLSSPVASQVSITPRLPIIGQG
jgi:hypothetical protein